MGKEKYSPEDLEEIKKAVQEPKEKQDHSYPLDQARIAACGTKVYVR